MERRLVAVDLDNTLLGDDIALALLNTELARRRPHIMLAYVTGRTRDSAAALMAEGRLLAPDYLIVDVGGAIYRAPNWQEELQWRRHLQADWDPRRLRTIGTLFPALTPQPPSHQGAFKLSYYLPRSEAPCTLPLVTDALKRQRLRAKLVYSSGADLDIVPARSGKARAVAFLARRLGLRNDQVFTCGDSGNDLDMLAAGYLGAAVGNAQPELLSALPPSVYRSARHFAAGVHEALQHYGWINRPNALR